ncbi:hypothetical protein U9M48_013387, partial [Paspalum notatum var. saurae]
SNMGRRWKDVMVKDSIGGMHQLTLRLCMIALMFQQQGLTFVMPDVRPPPVSPQWGMFAQIPFSPMAQGSGVQASNPYHTPPPGSGQYGYEHDFVNNLFAFGGTSHNSNEPGDM